MSVIAQILGDAQQTRKAANVLKEMGGAEGKVAYIDTEGTFRPERIIQIAERFGGMNYLMSQKPPIRFEFIMKKLTHNTVDPEQAQENIAYARALNSEHQLELLNALSMQFASNEYRLLIIDSIMNCFRVDFCGRGELADRQQKLNQFLSKLAHMAEEFNVCVLMTNQVQSDPGASALFAGADGRKPVGGHILAHASTTRVLLRKGRGEERVAKIQDSPDCPEREATYIITSGGITDPEKDVVVLFMKLGVLIAYPGYISACTSMAKSTMVSKKPDIPSSINGYTVLPVELQVLSSFKDSAIHYLYLRQHEPKTPTPDDARTLFAVNVPFDATEAHFRYLFAGISGGRVDNVKFLGSKQHSTNVEQPIAVSAKGSKKRKRDRMEQQDKAAGELPETWDRELHPPGSTALIIFVDKGSLDATTKALKRYGKGKLAVWGEGVEGEKVPALGSQRYLAHHALRYPPPSTLQSSINTHITNYAAAEAARAQNLARQRQEPDEDGFITVVRGGRTGPARHEEAAAAAEKQKGKGEYRDFYRFQLREERKKHVGELVRRFEEDKRKVEEMKGRRGRFKVCAILRSLFTLIRHTTA
ncbi:hypothetical protein FGG08_002624 [Glutinoglossum americanum]|uniref:Meiotic recombination protein DMC1 n=1 Tax=Glutinoglossum americanum TaxID=1670608 RepID=A0A9P8I5X5_9PEZI|nr:hypothetical protein FGG08_002624 [Glutinoglossum americanum]